MVTGAPGTNWPEELYGLRGQGRGVVLGIHDLQVARIGIADKSAMLRLAGRRGRIAAAAASRNENHD